MENKYYTPSIEEFYVGFECEFKSAYQEGLDEWEVIEYTDDHFGGKLKDYMEYEQFRVKYLDKEDIETSGFKYTLVKTKERDTAGKLVEYESSVYKMDSEDGWLLDHFKETGYIMIRKTLNNDFGPTTRFIGKVKNKSELKQILVQLCVE